MIEVELAWNKSREPICYLRSRASGLRTPDQRKNFCRKNGSQARSNPDGMFIPSYRSQPATTTTLISATCNRSFLLLFSLGTVG